MVGKINFSLSCKGARIVYCLCIVFMSYHGQDNFFCLSPPRYVTVLVKLML